MSDNKYVILRETCAADLSFKVQSYLNDGWKLQGGPFFAESCYAQAVVKLDSKGIK